GSNNNASRSDMGVLSSLVSSSSFPNEARSCDRKSKQSQSRRLRDGRIKKLGDQSKCAYGAGKSADRFRRHAEDGVTRYVCGVNNGGARKRRDCPRRSAAAKIPHIH